MDAFKVNSARFPPVGDRATSWAPVYLEPMAGSGERLTALVVARDLGGRWHVEQAIREQAFRCMYGDRGDQFLGVVLLVQESLQDHLAMGGEISDWEAPITSCYLGPLRQAIGESVEQVVARATRLVASLASDSAVGPEVAEKREDDAPAAERWTREVRHAVVERRQAFDARFNGEVTIRTGASPTKIGYLGENIAANFDALVPGSNLTNRRHRSKSRLIDLQILKDIDRLILRNSYELLLWVPPKNSIAYSERQLAGAYAVLAELEEFGDKHELRVRSLESADAAADVILAAEGA